MMRLVSFFILCLATVSSQNSNANPGNGTTVEDDTSSSTNKKERVTPIVLPPKISLRAAVIPTPPFGIVETDIYGTTRITGFHYDLIEAMKEYAALDGVEFDITLEEAPTPSYGPALDWIANDCNTTVNPMPKENCDTYDLILGDYYVNEERAMRVNFSPAYLRTAMTTVKYLEKTRTPRDYTTMQQAVAAGEVVCALNGTYLSNFIMGIYPEADWRLCGPGLLDCIQDLKDEKCVLYVEDEHKLKFRAVHDFTLEVTREVFSRQYYVWPMSFTLDPVVVTAIKKWMYTAVALSRLDELYYKYFEIKTCPVGAAGESCELPCDPDHGTSDKMGRCVCASSRWTGADCSQEIPEEKNLIPQGLMIAGMVAFGFNVLACIICGIWLLANKGKDALKYSQPSFLVLVLVGCIISSSTILALAQEDAGDGPVRACQAVPWLYSIGFCITFGTLFAKIRRTYIMFQSAARMKRVTVTVKETLAVVAGLVFIDTIILVVWTVVDPLQWERTVVTEDVFGHPLETVGQCTCDNWAAFAGAIAGLHFILLCIACWYCYLSRNIPDQFSEGKYLSVAMISNMQIFVVGIPVLLIIGSDSGTGFFVASVIIWMNDIVVVALIFGPLMYRVWKTGGEAPQKPEELRSVVNSTLRRYSQSQKTKQSRASYAGSGDSAVSGVSNEEDGSMNFGLPTNNAAAMAQEEKESAPRQYLKKSFNNPAVSIDEDKSMDFGLPTNNAAVQVTSKEEEGSSPRVFQKTSWIGVEDVTTDVTSSPLPAAEDRRNDVDPTNNEAAAQAADAEEKSFPPVSQDTSQIGGEDFAPPGNSFTS